MRLAVPVLMVVPPDAAQVPLAIRIHPAVKLIPFANVEVPVPWTLITPVVSMTPAVVVAIPTPNPPVRYVFPEIESSWEGEVVPIPTLPTLSTIRSVPVAEPTVNLAAPSRALTESRA